MYNETILVHDEKEPQSSTNSAKTSAGDQSSPNPLSIKPGSHRHRIGQDGPTNVKSSNFWWKRPDFCRLQKAKSAASLGIRPFRSEFRTVLTPVGPPHLSCDGVNLILADISSN